MTLRAGKFGPFYACERYPLCKGTHGAHPNGDPLGVPGGPETRAARQRAHAAFDRLWQGQFMSRREAYKWLHRRFGREVHIGALSTDECREVEAYVLEFFDEKVQNRGTRS